MLTADGFFFITQDDIENDTGLSEYQQRTAFKKLMDLGIVIVEKKGGLNRANYYKVVDHALLKYLTSQGLKIEPSDVKKVDDTNTIITNTVNTNTINKQLEDEPPISLKKERNKNKYIGAATTSSSPQTVRPLLKANYPDYPSLVDWYEYVGIKKKLSFKQIEDKVKKLEDECGHNTYIIDQQINLSYQNNYVSFFPPKEEKKKFYSNSKSTNKVDDSGYVAL